MMRFWLHTVDGVFEFATRHLTLGRDRRVSGFVLPDTSVKPVHALLVVEDDRLFVDKVEHDCLTFLNRSPIHGKTEVFDGDSLDIGPWTLVVRSPHLDRRHGDHMPLHDDMTPSDVTIIHRVKLKNLPRPKPQREDSTGSFIL